MKLSEIYALAEKIAPKRLSDEYCASYGAYDNSGVLVDAGEKIDKILFSLDLSDGAVDKAIAEGAKLIITHHPAIYGKISAIRCDDKNLLGGKLVRCLRHGISVLSFHLNLDGAVGGIDDSLMQGVALSSGKTTGAGTKVSVMHPLSDGGYGKAYALSKIALKDLKKNMEKTFSSSRILMYGDEEKTVERAASFCGAGADEEAVAFALREGADVIVSADFKHHVLTLATESGLSVIALTHYASEQYGFEKFYEKIRRQVEIPCVLHADENLL